ncbi:MAG: N-acetyltransferase [Hyphomicrobium sp.]|nr:N-acetyltransferase [Hyphomicrobium sp.]
MKSPQNSESRPCRIDPTAIVHPDARLGPGVAIWNWSKVREGATIGDGSNVGQSVYIDFNVAIGKRCKIQNGVSIYHGVMLGDDVFVGPNACFTNDLRPRAHSQDWQVTPTRVENGASIGANATIICGVVLGAHCMVAAGAVVTKDVPPYALVMGCPARIVDYVTISGRRMQRNPSLGRPPLQDLEDKQLTGEGAS